MLGKLNMDQFAMGFFQRNQRFRQCDFTNGGVMMVAIPIWPPVAPPEAAPLSYPDVFAPAATGTDTGGSIRQPAAFVGITGFKPTYGRCSRWGTIAFASSLDQAGPMAHDVRDCAIMLESMAGFDPKDSTSLDLPVPEWEAAPEKRSYRQEVSVFPRNIVSTICHPKLMHCGRKALQWLKDAGAKIVDVSLPHTKYALPAYYIIAPAEASSNLARYDGVRYGMRDLPDGAGTAGHVCRYSRIRLWRQR